MYSNCLFFVLFPLPEERDFINIANINDKEYILHNIFQEFYHFRSCNTFNPFEFIFVYVVRK